MKKLSNYNLCKHSLRPLSFTISRDDERKNSFIEIFKYKLNNRCGVFTNSTKFVRSLDANSPVWKGVNHVSAIRRKYGYLHKMTSLYQYVFTKEVNTRRFFIDMELPMLCRICQTAQNKMRLSNFILYREI